MKDSLLPLVIEFVGSSPVIVVVVFVAVIVVAIVVVAVVVLFVVGFESKHSFSK